MKISKEKQSLIIAGAITGIISVILVLLGNPTNMGFCIACFYRDIAGALSLHSAAVVQYVRPEIIGLLLGAFLISLVKKEFKPRGGSSPVLRFVFSAFVMIGALVFLGCPFRMVLRLAGGDLNALVALFGFIAGIIPGSLLLNKGFTLGRSYKQSKVEGGMISGLFLGLLVVLLFIPSLLKFSESGPGSMRAPIIISLVAGLVVGALAQRNRFCMAGGVRDVFLFRDSTLLTGLVLVFVSALVMNLVTGNFTPGFTGQAVAHTDWLWNFLGMALVGYGSVLLGGCPLRQTILAGEGNVDSVMSVLGMLAGAAISHNFGLASSGKGTTVAGRIAVILGFVVITTIAFVIIQAKKKEA
ncbi:MAG TPA: YedE family putative selenium transporter [Sphaerochaeta sp.]|nr:YedE family putative selenium transporter [Spirochaetota bacterium]HOE88497.1 YedE family putative selenium transporter [Sphaerochaeta sp.]HOR80759.1 YedE family putative selenium transporter [Sphaerochaeta sp.]HPK63535.1 YedE family putative selenium transporter [Sphaerochaeta sp.]